MSRGDELIGQLRLSKCCRLQAIVGYMSCTSGWYWSISHSTIWSLYHWQISGNIDIFQSFICHQILLPIFICHQILQPIFIFFKSYSSRSSFLNFRLIRMTFYGGTYTHHSGQIVQPQSELPKTKNMKSSASYL